MAQEYPDILGDLADATQRWEVDGVQYVGLVEPNSTRPGQVVTISLYVQSALDVPIDFQSTLDLPRKPQGFSVSELASHLQLKAGEVGRLQVPVQVGAQIPPGNYALRMDLRGKPTARGQRVRPSASKSELPNLPIQDFVGLDIAPVVRLSYSSKMNARPVFNVTVAGTPESVETEMSPVFEELWSPADLELQGKAVREFNDRRAHLVKPLTREAIFSAFLNESRQRFGACGVELKTGESIFIAKMLTRGVETFLQTEATQNALFVPIFKRLLKANVPSDSALWLLMKFGFEHVTNISISLAFAMIENYRRGRVWPLEEQRAARRFIVERLAAGQPLPLDLVYAPLIIGGILAHSQLKIEGEDVADSLKALTIARNARLRELTEEDDQIISLLDSLLPAQSV